MLLGEDILRKWADFALRAAETQCYVAQEKAFLIGRAEMGCRVCGIELWASGCDNVAVDYLDETTRGMWSS